jgi:uncharacterized protein YcbX
MGGEPIVRVALRPRFGIEGDRAFALLDEETGRVASAKQPRKWGRLLECAATWTSPGARVALPDGRIIRSDDADVHERLSAFLGRRVRLVDRPPTQATFEEHREERDSDTPLAIAAPVGTFFDFAPLHLVTTSTLAALAERAPHARFDPLRFRANLLIDTGEVPAFVEDEWVGREIAIGEARLTVLSSCPRCVMTSLPQAGLPADPTILRTIADSNLRWFPLLARKLPSAGVYAMVTRGGEIAVDDPIQTGGRAPFRRAGAFFRAIKRALIR